MISSLNARPSAGIIRTLNGVRGIAILLVLSVHLVHIGYVHFAKGALGTVVEVMWMGWVGVDLFFVLSGFLITGILLDTQTSPNYFQSFYMRRILRIFPLYYLVVVLSFVAMLVLRGTHFAQYVPNRGDLVSMLFYVQNYRGLPLAVGHLWSLALEEQFYLLWPLIVFRIRSRRVLAWVLVALLCAFAASRFAAVGLYGRHYNLDAQLYFRGDGMLVGALLAMAVRDARMLKRCLKLAPAVAVFCSLAFLWIAFGPLHEVVSRETYTRLFGFPLLALLFGAMVLLAWKAERTGSGLDRLLCHPFLQVSGKYSYGLYMYHAPVFIVGGFAAARVHHAMDHGWTRLLAGLAAVALSYGVAFVSFRFYELPMLKWKERFNAITPQHDEHPDFPERDVIRLDEQPALTR